MATNNATTAATALKLMRRRRWHLSPPERHADIELFNGATADYPVFNKPAHRDHPTGTVLAFAEGRATQQTTASYAIVMRRSTDGGVTWSVQQVVGMLPITGVVIGQPPADRGHR